MEAPEGPSTMSQGRAPTQSVTVTAPLAPDLSPLIEARLGRRSDPESVSENHPYASEMGDSLTAISGRFDVRGGLAWSEPGQNRAGSR